MSYRTRRIEQRRQKRLGCFILVTAVVAAIILASIIMAFVPPIPVAATIAFYALAVLIAGAIERRLRRLLGYQARKASLQHLTSDLWGDPLFPSSAQPNSSPGSSDSENKTTGFSLVVQVCPNCKTRVLPKADGTCPACQKRFPA